MWKLNNPIRHYAWGSTQALPNLFGLPTSGEPIAELWLGAHPDGPSSVLTSAGSVPLHDFIAQDPHRMLGARTCADHGQKLPFLVKFLAPAQSLSLQVHPNAAQARAGWRAEEAAGVPASAAHRRYKDDQPKPELLVALTDFSALCGFRSPAQVQHDVAGYRGPGHATLGEVLAQAAASGSWSPALTWFFSPDCCVDFAELISSLPAEPYHESSPIALLPQLSHDYPGDPGLLVALCMHQVMLTPGEGLYIPAGLIHAYQDGVGLEVMAASDNVLRAGLTPKHVDVPELLRLLDASYGPVSPTASTPTALGRVWPAGENYFQLRQFTAQGNSQSCPLHAATIVVCTAGSAELRTADVQLTLAAGQACFIPAYTHSVDFWGAGELAAVSTPHG